MMKKPQKILMLLIPILGIISTAFSQTENLDFEFGNFDNWILDTGVRSNPTTIDWNTRPANDLGVQIKLMSPSSPSYDEIGLNCFPTPVNVPTVFTGGRFSARIGNLDGENKAARISHTFTVTPNTTLLKYSYAVVLEDPGHKRRDQPKFVANIKDSNGNIVPCGRYEAFSGPNALNKGFINCGKFQILPWTTESADLSPFIGEDITIEFIALDCTLGEHGGYAYVDASLEPLKIQVEDLCNNGDTVTLNAPEGFSSYDWSNGDGTPSITIENAKYGETYSVDFTSNTGCLSKLSITLEPTPQATIDKIPDQEVCLGGSVLVKPTGNHTGDFRYTRPDPTNPGEFVDIAPAGNSAILSPTQDTTYTIIARDENGCDGPSETFSVKVINSNGPPFPKADFEIETIATMGNSICNTIQLKNLSDYCKGGLSYHWDFGDGTTSTETNPSHSFPVTNDNSTYIITLTVRSQDGLTESKSYEYNTFITAKFSTSFLNCETVTINNTSDICGASIDNFADLVYHWDFGDGSSIVSTNNSELSLTHIYTASGTFTIILTISNINNPGTSLSTHTETLDINIETKTDFSYLVNCLDVTFTDESKTCSRAESYIWDFGDGSTASNEVRPKHTYTSSGSFNVTLTINDGVQIFTQSKEITLDITETIPDYEFEINCDVVSFTNLSNSCDDLTYYWDFGDNSPISNDKNPTHRYDLNKAYNVTLTVNDGTRDLSVTKSFTLGNGITGYNTPQDMILCRNPDATKTPIFDLAAQKNYILEGLADNNLELPTVSFHLASPEAFNGLRPLPLRFKSLSSSQQIYARITNQNGCVEVFMFSLNIVNTPIVNPIEDIHLCSLNESNTEYNLSQLNAKIFDGIDQSNIKLSYHLFEGDAIQGINSIEQINLNAGVEFIIYARAEDITSNQCYSLSTFSIRMDNDDTDTNNNCMPFFANTMTPNGDGRNDTFFIKNIEKFSNNTLTIYNRWGNIVYRATGYNNTWNGMHKGKPLPSGNYYYYFQLNDGTNRSHSGYITILR
ncbi:gliding motility-associated C-terminal domain-containing protein [Seonamhaeicola sp. ML3]|uniref:gliding motility-associated C-terminal domain-containing protein n=1 Tax=Seonamhaeicola sp. ML3 TaxID=2937786 RepID=UPI00200D6771|nr:gliding motility-associated C-terminal domain-containing protein [Seonamhaeicola sp. ML3]